jgi:hypothetical protein
MEEGRHPHVRLGEMTIFTIYRKISKRIPLYAALVIGGVLAVWMASFVPNADWYGTFDPAGRGIFHGRSPYEQPLFLNPPWAVLLLLPFVLFPPALARGLILVCSLASLIYVAWRLHAPKVAVIALLLSPTAIGSLLAANLDAFVLLGVFLPPTWGLLALMIKPQIGLGPAVYHLIETWRSDKVRGVLLTFAPVVMGYIVGAILFPVWMDRMIHKPGNVWNRSIFPYGIPLGVFFLWLAVRTRNVFFALASTPFFSPYLTFYTYLVVQIGLLHEDVERVVRRDALQIVFCVFLWVIMLVFKL